MEKQTILLVAAHPKQTTPLNLIKELKTVYNNFKFSDKNNLFNVEQIVAATYDDLSKALHYLKPSIVHFACHGIGEKGLILVDPNENEEIIDTETLINLFRIACEENRNINCVIFNTCYGEFQAQKLKKYVKYTIGMSKEIRDDYAIIFATTFYQFLASSKIETAFEYARNKIRHEYTKQIQKKAYHRAEYDPAPDDERVEFSIPDYQIPKLIVNEYLDDLLFKDHLIASEKSRVLTYKQWEGLENILVKIDRDIDKLQFIQSICKELLREDIKDIEREILKIEKLVDLKRLLLESYPTHKNNDTLTILEFAERLIKEKGIAEEQKDEIKEWLKETAKEKNINLPILPEETESTVQQSETLNSHLLISIIENTDLSENFSLEAELVFDYQEGKTDYKSKIITFDQEGINAISPEDIKSYVLTLIDRAIDELSPPYNLTIELFVPSDYLGKTFELLEISKRKRRRALDSQYQSTTLGAKYKFVVRCLERYEEKDLFNDHWKVWKRIKAFLEKKKCEQLLETIKCDYLILLNQEHNWNKLCTKWQENNFYSINVIDELSDDEKDEDLLYFYKFVDSGVPIALWTRKHPNNLCHFDGNNYTIDTIKGKFREILQVNSINDLTEIVKRIYEERKKAHDEGDKAEIYLGYNLGFIFDNPDLIPSNLLKALNGENRLKGTN